LLITRNCTSLTFGSGYKVGKAFSSFVRISNSARWAKETRLLCHFHDVVFSHSVSPISAAARTMARRVAA
jgi:hypothetical protein